MDQPDDPYRFDPARFDDDAPAPARERPRRGCVFYGCVTAAVLAVVAAIVVAIGLALVYRAFNTFVKEYAEDAPAPIPVAEMPAGEVERVEDRLRAFRDAIAAGKAAEPLVLSAEEINALIAQDEDLRGVVAVDFENDEFRGRVSLPLEDLGFPGKFLNGAATFDVRIDNGLLLVTVETLEVRGKPLPEDAMSRLRMENLAKAVNRDPDDAAVIARIERIEVKGGKLVVTPKPPPPAEAKPEPEAEGADPAPGPGPGPG